MATKAKIRSFGVVLMIKSLVDVGPVLMLARRPRYHFSEAETALRLNTYIGVYGATCVMDGYLGNQAQALYHVLSTQLGSTFQKRFEKSHQNVPEEHVRELDTYEDDERVISFYGLFVDPCLLALVQLGMGKPTGYLEAISCETPFQVATSVMEYDPDVIGYDRVYVLRAHLQALRVAADLVRE